MLKITVASEDVFYRKGLESLIVKTGNIIKDGLVEILSDKDGSAVAEADIVFRDIMISISFNNNRCGRFAGKGRAENSLPTLHIPFTCRGDNLQQITGKIKKILLIASNNALYATSRESCKIAGLKKFMQLSSTESKVMLMVGQGYDTGNISRMLGRSEKTVNTHCRNAIRKMGMLNRVEFYKYASYIARSGGKKGNTLCL